MHSKIDNIRVGELHVNLLDKTAPQISAKAAFVDTRTGRTHGWTTNLVWSREVFEALDTFRAVLEKHLATVHFTDAAADVATQEKLDVVSVMEKQPETVGLAEWLSEGTDGSQVT